MTQSNGEVARVAQEDASPSTEVPNVRRWLFASALFLLVQVAATDYGDPAGAGPAILWFAVGVGLLWLVYRRHSRVARVVVVVASLAGAIIYALEAFGSLHAAVLTIAYLGQALPLVTGPVRRHVQVRPPR